MDKIKTTTNFIYATDILRDYLFNIIDRLKYEDNRLLDKKVLASLKVLIMKFLIISLKEDVIEKPKNDTYKNRLVFYDVNNLADMIATKQEDNSYRIGSYSFKDAEEVIAKIRNKFAHSDFLLSEDSEKLLINFDGTYEAINIDSLAKFSALLFKSSRDYKKENQYRKTFPICKPSGISKLAIYNDSYLDDIIEQFEIMTTSLKSNEGNIDEKAYTGFDNYIKSIFNIAYYYRDDKPQVVYEKVRKEIFSNANWFNRMSSKNGWNCELKVEVIELSESEKNDLKSLINDNLDLVGMTVKQAEDEIARMVARTFDESYNCFNTYGQAASLLYVIDLIEKMNTTNVVDIFNRVMSYSPGLALRFDQDTLGIVEILRLLVFTYILENMNIDYSNIDLSVINPEVFFIDDIELRELYKSKEAVINSLEKNGNKLREKEIQLNNMESSIVPLDKIELIKGIIADLRTNRDELDRRFDELTTKIEYVRKDRSENSVNFHNQKLIEAIRNSLSHGNVKIIPNGMLRDSIMTFEDYNENNELVFRLNISIDEIDKILNTSINSLTNKKKRRWIRFK